MTAEMCATGRQGVVSLSGVSLELPDWVRFSIADAVVVFGRLEQELIEIAWLIKSETLIKERVRLARNSTTDNFLYIIGLIEQVGGAKLEAVRSTFLHLTYDRNLIVHGSWIMRDGRPFVVWHKFLEDVDNVVGEFFDQSRFHSFMLKANILLETCRSFHNEIEKRPGKSNCSK